jgi:hypothetical protein
VANTGNSERDATPVAPRPKERTALYLALRDYEQA